MLAGQIFVKNSCTKFSDTRSQVDERIDLCGLVILQRALRSTVHFIASFCHPVSCCHSVMSTYVNLPVSVTLSLCQLFTYCAVLQSLTQCVADDARRLCWCLPARSELSTARRFTGSPVTRGSTRSSRSRFCPSTGTRVCSCLRGTGTRKRGRDQHLVS